MKLGQIGIWRSRSKGDPGASCEIEALGYGALWLGGSPSVEQARPYVEATTHAPRDHRHPQRLAARPGRRRARRTRSSRRDHPDRFLLGIGDRPPGGDERLHAPAEDDAGLLRRPRRRRDAGAEGRARSPPRSARRCSTWPASARSAPTRTSSTSSTRASPASASARTRWSPPRSPSWSSPTPRPPAGIAREYAKLYLGPEQLHEQPAQVRLHGGDIDDGGSDRLIDAVIPHGSRRAGRRSGPRPPRGGRRPRLPAAARPWDRAAARTTRALAKAAALATHAQPAERLLDQLRAVGGRRHLLEAEAQQQRVVGRRAGEEVDQLAGPISQSPPFGGLPGGRAGRRSRCSSRPRTRRPSSCRR